LHIENGVWIPEEAVDPLVDEGEGVEDDGDHHHEEHLTVQQQLLFQLNLGQQTESIRERKKMEIITMKNTSLFNNNCYFN
jgi:hypothetical protein